MWGKRFTVAIMAMAVVLAAGCGRPAAKKANPAQERAVAFFRAYQFANDFEAVWDMSLPRAFPDYKTKEQFLEFWSRLPLTPQPEMPMKVEEHERVDDRLYLVSTSEEQMLIWVTQTPEGWKVRKYAWYHGGPIPW